MAARMAVISPLSLMAALTDEVGRWGDKATELQWADARAILSLDGPRRHWLGRAKGYSKTRDVGALTLVCLLTQFPPGATGYVAAADAEQAGLLRQSIASFVTNTPELSGLVNVDARKIATSHGAEVVILAADSAGAHGLRPYWLVCDELANWPDTPRHREFFDYLWAGLPKVDQSRGIVITTAGTPSHFAAKIFETARLEPSWRCSNVSGPPPWADSDEIAAERRRLFPSTFARLWMNEWAAPDDAIADPDDVAAACVLNGPLPPEQGRAYVATVDLGTRNDRTAVVIAHAERDQEGTRSVVVDRLQVWTPRPGAPVSLDEVRAWLAEMCGAYRAKLLYDPSQAYLLVEQLRKSGVRCEEFVFSSSSVGRLATSIMQALRSRSVLLPDDDALRNELLAVRLRETSPNVLRIDTRSGGHDDRVIAVAMAVYELTSKGHSNSAAAWLESLAPICSACGQPNAKDAAECSKCRAPITSTETEAPEKPAGWRWSTPIPDRQPTPETAAALQMLRELQRTSAVFE